MSEIRNKYMVMYVLAGELSLFSVCILGVYSISTTPRRRSATAQHEHWKIPWFLGFQHVLAVESSRGGAHVALLGPLKEDSERSSCWPLKEDSLNKQHIRRSKMRSLMFGMLFLGYGVAPVDFLGQNQQLSKIPMQNLFLIVLKHPKLIFSATSDWLVITTMIDPLLLLNISLGK